MELICGFVFAYAKFRFSHDAAHLRTGRQAKIVGFVHSGSHVVTTYSNASCMACRNTSGSLRNLDKLSFTDQTTGNIGVLLHYDDKC